MIVVGGPYEVTTVDYKVSGVREYGHGGGETDRRMLLKARLRLPLHGQFLPRRLYSHLKAGASEQIQRCFFGRLDNYHCCVLILVKLHLVRLLLVRLAEEPLSSLNEMLFDVDTNKLSLTRPYVIDLDPFPNLKRETREYGLWSNQNAFPKWVAHNCLFG